MITVIHNNQPSQDWPLLSLKTTNLHSIKFRTRLDSITFLVLMKKKMRIIACPATQKVQILIRSLILRPFKGRALWEMRIFQVRPSLKSLLLLSLIIQLFPRQTLPLSKRDKGAVPKKKKNVWQKVLKSLTQTDAAK